MCPQVDRFVGHRTAGVQLDSGQCVIPSIFDSFQKTWQAGEVVENLNVRQLLQEANLRVTRPRMAVLNAVHAHPHSDTETIIAAARVELPELSHQTVYDSLRTLTAAGLLQRIQPAGSLPRYESHVGNNHHHVVCRSCNLIADVDCAVGDAFCLTPSDDHGFVIDTADVIYWGVCPSCSTSQHA